MSSTPQVPVSGQISSTYGARPRDFHQGVDIATPTGSAVAPMVNGTVSQAGYNDGYGNEVTVTAPDGTSTIYAHLSQVNVSVGQSVTQSDTLGLSGGDPSDPNSGTSTGSHLHFQINDSNGNSIDPATVLPQLGTQGNSVTQGQNATGSTVTNPQVAGSPGTSTQTPASTSNNTSPTSGNAGDVIVTIGAPNTGINPNATVVTSSSTSTVSTGLPSPSIQINSINDFDKYLVGNPLSNYANYDFHFELFVLPPESWNKTTQEIVGGSTSSTNNYSGPIPDSVTRLTIAETGVTGYNIKDVVIKNQLNQMSKGTLTSGLLFDIRIIEPAGVTLLDRLLNATRRYGIPNLASAPIFLNLYFMGYSDVDGSHTVIPNANQLWRLQIRDIDVSYEQGAGLYLIKAVEASNAIDSTDSGIPKVTGNIVAKDIDDYIVQLTGRLNDMSKQNAIKYANVSNGGIIPPYDTYKIILNDIPILKTPADKKMRSEDAPKNHPNTKGDFYDPTKYTFQFGNGESVIKMIEVGMNNTVGIMKAIARSNNTDTTGLPNGKDTDNIMLYSIDMKVAYKTKVSDYDIIRNRYTKDITIYVNGQVQPSGATVKYTNNQSQNSHPDDYLVDSNAQKQRMATKIAYGFVAKRYDYMYTGLNTEIIRLDLKFDALWAAVLSASLGNASYNTAQPGAVYVPGLYARNFLSGTGTSDVVYANNVVTAALKNAQANAAGIAQQLPNNVFGNADAVNLQNQVAYQQATAQLYNLTKLQLLNQRQGIAPGRQFIEAASLAPVPPLPIQLMPSFVSFMNANYGAEPSGRRGVSQVNTIMSQLSEGKAMVEIDMEVRGDPYWLGLSRTDKQYFTRNIISDVKAYNSLTANATTTNPVTAISTPYPKFVNGAYQLVLMFRMPGGLENDDSNQLNLAYSPLITGFYRVISAEHTFRDGMFTQTLRCIREYMTNIQTILPQSSATGGKAATQ